MAERETWEQREERERKEAVICLEKACSVLQRLQVQSIKAHYDGSGDEGFIEKVEYIPAPSAGIPEGLEELINQYVGTHLPPGWEINAGSSGTMTIDVVTRQATQEHYWKDEEFEDEGEEIDQ